MNASVRPSICPSRYLLLNLLVELNQTCYMTDSQRKSVQKQRCFFVRPSVRRSSICLSRYLILNHWVEFNQTCYIISPRDKDCESDIFFPFGARPSSVCPIVRHAFSSQTTELNLTKLATSLPFMVKVCESESVRPAISVISTERGDLQWRAIDFAF